MAMQNLSLSGRSVLTQSCGCQPSDFIQKSLIFITRFAIVMEESTTFCKAPI